MRSKVWSGIVGLIIASMIPFVRLHPVHLHVPLDDRLGLTAASSNETERFFDPWSGAVALPLRELAIARLPPALLSDCRVPQPPDALAYRSCPHCYPILIGGIAGCRSAIIRTFF